MTTFRGDRMTRANQTVRVACLSVLLYQDDRTAQFLADATESTENTILRILKRLEAGKLIQRTGSVRQGKVGREATLWGWVD